MLIVWLASLQYIDWRTDLVSVLVELLPIAGYGMFM